MLLFEIFVGVFVAELLMFVIANKLYDDDDEGPDGWT